MLSEGGTHGTCSCDEVVRVKNKCPSVGHPENSFVEAIAENLMQKFGAPPKTMLVLGSGLGAVVTQMNIEAKCSAN